MTTRFWLACNVRLAGTLAAWSSANVIRVSPAAPRRVSTSSLLFRAALAACVNIAIAVRDDLDVRPDPPSYAQVNAWSPSL